MCGIVGYIGKRDSVQIIMDGLKRLEYRGYDSAGIVVLNENNEYECQKNAGKVSELDNHLKETAINGKIGIGHTRWATHGEPNDNNAHPHFDMNKNITIVHNGIIENYMTLKKKLTSEGFEFYTDTDTEVLANLIEYHFRQKGSFEIAVRLALTEVEGTYGIAALCKSEPDKVIIARMGSPLMFGLGKDEVIVSSDAAAIVSHTKNVIYLEDGEIAVIKRDTFQIKTIKDEDIFREVEKIEYDLEQIEKGGYDHFMLKEIFEQPTAIQNTYRGRINFETGEVKLGGLDPVKDRLVNAKRIIIAACGTAWHAALAAEYMIEQYCRIPVEVEYASEFRYRDPIINKDDVIVFISQSGETLDTLEALKLAKRHGATTIGIVNRVGSLIAREVEAGSYIHAGPEIGVASTKAFTCQLMSLVLITLMIARHKKTMSDEELKRVAAELKHLPDKMISITERCSDYKFIAEEFKDSKNFLYLGRGINFPLALEGALKLKEISYIHAEGYPAAEMKHGPIALIDENMPVVFIAPKDKSYDKIINNIQEIKTRKGKVITISTDDDTVIEELSDYVLKVPNTEYLLSPILNIIPLQFLSYYIATLRGTNVDQPRNLAKSVTVE